MKTCYICAKEIGELDEYFRTFGDERGNDAIYICATCGNEELFYEEYFGNHIPKYEYKETYDREDWSLIEQFLHYCNGKCVDEEEQVEYDWDLYDDDEW